MILFMWYPLRILVRILPHEISYRIGVMGGHILYLFSKEKRHIMSKELKLVFPGMHVDKIRNIVKSSFINYAVSELEVLFYPYMDSDFIKKVVTIEGREHLDRALREGRGVLLFQAHFGAFQMVMPAIGYSGYKMNQISSLASDWAEQSSSKVIKKTFNKKADYEHALPINHISIRASLRPAFRALEKNEIVGITIDGGGGKKVVTVKFLGRDANFQQGAVDLAIRTGATILPAFITTEKGIKHTLTIHPPLCMNNARKKDDNIRSVLGEFIELLEDYVYRYPFQYGYTLYLRRSRAGQDPYPFFKDQATSAKGLV